MSAFRRGSRKPYSRPPPRDVNSQWVHDKAPGVSDTKDALSGSRRGPSSSTAPDTKLVVSNLHYEITSKDLSAIFGQIGTLVREPFIRYDRSGRSSGVAIISYETVEEATKAKKQFHGILAKGQPMEITFDTQAPRPNSRRSVSAPTHSLLNRIQKPGLADRLPADDIQVGGVLTANIKPTHTSGPIRSRPNRNRGGKPNTQSGFKASKSSKSAPKKPKTAEELDKELDAFMGDADLSAATAGTPVEVAPEGGSSATTAEVAATTTTAEAPAQDVEMA
ncbi:RNA-binding domain-containing protein [Dendrothele bispora CBS 962.96]|uniref:RNA-binding domain-containing protein n=1 Tax=Dendrothele bispora (strain CBS 962.96) TaxID=1314807 RepID=A0A4S8MDP6_DENBC|nr:RNA-binding domain-containing protein [Dendrothele bispora CBS 962.96]